MEITNLLSIFDEAIEHTGEISAGLEFKNCPEIQWDSLGFLVLVSEVQGAYGVSLTADEVKAASTIESLFEVIQRKAG